MNYNELKTSIQSVIKTNEHHEITGLVLQQTLLSIVNSLGTGYQFVGMATPSTNPGTPDQKVYYIATLPGTYTHFSNIVISANEIVLLVCDSSWHKIIIDQRVVDLLRNEIVLYDKNHLTNNFYYLTGERAEISESGTTPYRTIKIPCRQGESYLIRTVGGTNARAWGIVDADMTILARAEANVSLLDGYVLNITQNDAAYLIVNNNISVTSALDLFMIEKNGSIKQEVLDVKKSNDTLQLATAGINNVMNKDAITFNMINTFYDQNPNHVRIIADKSMLFHSGDRLIAITLKSSGTSTEPSLAYIYDENNNLVDSFELGTIGNTDTRFDVSNRNIRLKDGYSVAVKGLFYGYVSSTNRFYDFASGDYVTSFCYGLSVEVERYATLAKKKTLKILSVGNSFAEDAFNYVPWILQNVCNDIDLVFGTLMRGGSTLSQHYLSFFNDSDDYAYRKWTPNIGDWRYVKESANCLDALNDENWDIVVFQQQSYDAANYSTYQPYLNDLIKLLFSKIDYPVKLGWLLTPSNRSDYGNSITDFTNILSAAQRVIEETAIEFMIPCGTAIQNARTTILRTIGDDGNLIKDSHLQEGLPCQIDSYAAVISLLNVAGFMNKSIYGDNIRATDEWLSARTIFGPNGSSVGITDDNCRLGQVCAMVANTRPLEITDCSNL